MTKNEYIVRQCRNKTVMDLGCLAHHESDHWLHGKINEVAKSVIGVDILPIKLEKFDILLGDIEKLYLIDGIKGKTFDVIVAGDIIEHLFNVGLFLDGVKRFCNQDTRIIITTPNVMSLYHFWPVLLTGNDNCRRDHTCWYSMKTLCQLLEMKGFWVRESIYTDDITTNGIRPFFRKMFHKALPYMGYRLIVNISNP